MILELISTKTLIKYLFIRTIKPFDCFFFVKRIIFINNEGKIVSGNDNKGESGNNREGVSVLGVINKGVYSR